MQFATLIKVDGSETAITPKNEKKFSLEELQGYVGGHIELTRTNKPVRDMYIDEEGKLKSKPINVKATELYQYGNHDPIVGDVVVIETKRTRKVATTGNVIKL